MAEDALIKKATADAIVERAARQLREVLHELVRRLDPFPNFPGSGIPAVEAEPGAVKNLNRGCVVVCPDGELYELWVSTDFSSKVPEELLEIQTHFDPTSVFQTEIKPLELTPQDYVVYAYNAVCALTEILEGGQLV
jgi:hypothetical protein